MTCESCGAFVKRVVLHGAALWCGPCHDAENSRAKAHSVIGDEIVGGFTQENFGHQPETFYSKHAMAKRADRLGLQPMVRHVEGDQHVPSWACMDPYTLAAATELVTRRALRSASESDEVPLETFQWSTEVK